MRGGVAEAVSHRHQSTPGPNQPSCNNGRAPLALTAQQPHLHGVEVLVIEPHGLRLHGLHPEAEALVQRDRGMVVGARLQLDPREAPGPCLLDTSCQQPPAQALAAIVGMHAHAERPAVRQRVGPVGNDVRPAHDPRAVEREELDAGAAGVIADEGLDALDRRRLDLSDVPSLAGDDVEAGAEARSVLITRQNYCNALIHLSNRLSYRQGQMGTIKIIPMETQGLTP